MIDPIGNKQAFFWDPSDGRPMLGTIDGSYSIALAFNNRVPLVGSFNHTEVGPLPPSLTEQPNVM